MTLVNSYANYQKGNLWLIITSSLLEEASEGCNS